MIAPQSLGRTAPDTVRLSEPVVAVELDQGPHPAQALADLYRCCSPSGGCPYTLKQLIRVLTELRSHSAGVVATEIAAPARLPEKAVYGCVLELEGYGLARWIPEPVLRADHVTAEVTGAGLRLLREIEGRTNGR